MKLAYLSFGLCGESCVSKLKRYVHVRTLRMTKYSISHLSFFVVVWNQTIDLQLEVGID